MNHITLETVKPKFYPSIVNRKEFPDGELKNKITRAFQTNKRTFPDVNVKHVFELEGLPNYVIKAKRTGEFAEILHPDTHLYRVRKALKIQRLIEQYSLQNHVCVPKKYLYNYDNKWYVVAEKLDLSPKVPEINKQYWSKGILEKADLGLSSSAVPISKEQCKALTIFAYEAGLTDLTLNNLFFTNDGKIAIIDTEPVKRNVFKILNGNIFNKFMNDKNLLQAAHSCFGLAKLRLSVNDQTTVSIINNTENYYIAMCTIKTIAKVAFLVIAFRYSGNIENKIGKRFVKVIIGIKILNILSQSYFLALALYIARAKDGKLINLGINLEKKGLM